MDGKNMVEDKKENAESMGKALTCYQCVSYKLDEHKPGNAQRCKQGHLICGYDLINTMCKHGFIPRQGGIALDEIRKEHETHLVFKIEDLEMMSQTDLQRLYEIDQKVQDWRKKQGKSTLGYLVVNRDEPYVDHIQEAILSGERMTKLGMMLHVLSDNVSKGFSSDEALTFQRDDEFCKGCALWEDETLRKLNCGKAWHKCPHRKVSRNPVSTFEVWKAKCELLQRDPSGELEICNHLGNPEDSEGNCCERNCPTFHKGERENDTTKFDKSEYPSEL